MGGTEQKFNLLVHREIQREYGQPRGCADHGPFSSHRRRAQKSKSLGNYVGITEPPSEIR